MEECCYGEVGDLIKIDEQSIYCSKNQDALDFIKWRRKKEGINLKAIGLLFGYDKANVSRILAGKRSLSIDKLITALHYFGYRMVFEPIVVNDETGEPDNYNYDDFIEANNIACDIESEPEKYKE